MILISAGLIAYIWLQPWAYSKTGDKLGMAIFPTAYAIIILLASVSQILVTMRHKGSSEHPIEEEPIPLWPVVLLCGAVLIATLGYWYFDAVVSSGAVVLLLLLVGGVRDWRVLSGLTIGTALLLYFLFVRVCGVYFPCGWFR